VIGNGLKVKCYHEEHEEHEVHGEKLRVLHALHGEQKIFAQDKSFKDTDL
jgi:hypothetical protein